MGFFFDDDTKKISRNTIEEELREISILSSDERHYLEGVFAEKAANGLSKEELKKILARLKANREDHIGSEELDAVYEKLTRKFED